MKVGSDSVDAVRFGSEVVSKVYYGTQLAWEDAPPGCTPYGTPLYDTCGPGPNYDFGTVYADGECGTYFDPWSPGGCL